MKELMDKLSALNKKFEVHVFERFDYKTKSKQYPKQKEMKALWHEIGETLKKINPKNGRVLCDGVVFEIYKKD